MTTPKATRKTSATRKTTEGFSDVEREAMKDRARELKAAKRPGSEDGTAEVLARIAAMAEPDRTMAGRLHALIMASVPSLSPRLWYGMPAYAKDGAVICHFQDAKKFKTRYATLGFSDKARLDDGNVWPTAFGISRLTAADEAKISALVKQAAG